MTHATPSPTVSVPCGVDDRLDELVDQLIGADDLDANLVDEVEHVLLAAKDLDVTAGAAKSLDLAHRETGHTGLLHRFFDLIEFERLDDRGY